jgi:Raf kinase inhibitor-like YbhB/YbcL family protein
MPEGAIQSRTDFGTDGWGGPCPPPDGKPHRYIFTVFAVDVDKLPDAKDDNASAALVGFDLHFHTLDKATLVGDLQPLIATVGSLVSLTQRDVRAA